jgi:CHAT domain-containing protein/tetratricopeptide (TPR) repeat protein
MYKISIPTRALLALLGLCLAPVEGRAALTAEVKLPPALEGLHEQSQELVYQNHLPEALELAKKALDQGRSSTLPASELSSLLVAVGEIEIRLGRYVDAEPHFRQALELLEGPGRLANPELVPGLRGLALTLVSQGHPEAGLPLLERSLQILDQAPGPPDTLQLALTLNFLGQLYIAMGKSELAEPITARIRKLSEEALRSADPEAPSKEQPSPASGSSPAADPDDPMPQMDRTLALLGKDDSPTSQRLFLLGLPILGAKHEQAGRLDDAEAAFRQVVEIADRSPGPRSEEAACARNALAGVVLARGHRPEAEALYRQALEILEARKDSSSEDLAFALSGLARAALTQKRPSEAEAFYQRSLAAMEKAFGSENPLLANVLYKLSSLQAALGRPDSERFRIATESRALYNRVLPEGHPLKSRSLPSIEVTYDGIARFLEATDCFLRLNRRFVEEQPTTTSEQVAASLEQAGDTYLWWGGYSQAEPLFLRALSIHRSVFGEGHPVVLSSLQRLSNLYLGWRHYDAGLVLARQATAQLGAALALSRQTDIAEALHQQAFRRQLFLSHLELLFGSLGGELGPVSARQEEAFVVSQGAHASRTALALGGAAARWQAQGARLAALVRRFQDLDERDRQADADLLHALGRPAGERDTAAEARLREQRRKLAGESAAVRTELVRDFPRYAEISFPQPLALLETQGLLRPGEALLLYSVGASSTIASLVWREGSRIERLQLSAETLSEQVTRLRRNLTLAHVGLERMRGHAVPDFDFVDAATLYRELVAPFRPQLSGVHHLFLVLDGPLESLPFSVLVDADSAAAASMVLSPVVPWLARGLSSSVLPTVSSLKDLRPRAGNSRARRSRAPRAFVGFGYPLQGRPVAESSSPPASGILSASSRLAAMRALRDAAELPETRTELQSLAQNLGGSSKDLYFQERATKSVLQGLRLDRFRVVAFSTHALMAGERGSAQPALVLSPAPSPSAASSDLLTAGEIAELKLDADLVLLLGCNTAASDGTPGAEGLSGLAKAFLYAGSRKLLVSHWAVPSEATTRLATGLFERLRRSPRLGEAEALRQAMLDLMRTPGRPELAHPVFWAPFVILGDGAARRSMPPSPHRLRR